MQRNKFSTNVNYTIIVCNLFHDKNILIVIIVKTTTHTQLQHMMHGSFLLHQM